MNPTTVFEFERDTNDVYDMIYDYLVNNYDGDELPSDKLDETIAEIQCRMCSQDNPWKMPNFQIYFYHELPKLYDTVSDIVFDAMDSYIVMAAKEIIG